MINFVKLGEGRAGLTYFMPISNLKYMRDFLMLHFKEMYGVILDKGYMPRTFPFEHKVKHILSQLVNNICHYQLLNFFAAAPALWVEGKAHYEKLRILKSDFFSCIFFFSR